MSKCPYCNRPTNPLRWIFVSSRTGYRCRFCNGLSRPPRWQTATAGGLGGGIGTLLALEASRDYGLVGVVAAVILVMTLMVLAMWLLSTLQPIEDTLDRR